MQLFNLVNDQEKVAQFVRRGMAWRGVALHCMALALGFISILGGWLQRLWGERVLVQLYQGVFGSSSGQQLLCILGMRLRMSSWLCLAQHSM